MRHGRLARFILIFQKQRRLINERARAADQNPDFSIIIREAYREAISESRNERHMFKLHISPVI